MGYHSLVPGLITIFLETVWVPLKFEIVIRYIGISDRRFSFYCYEYNNSKIILKIISS